MCDDVSSRHLTLRNITTRQKQTLPGALLCYSAIPSRFATRFDTRVCGRRVVAANTPIKRRVQHVKSAPPSNMRNNFVTLYHGRPRKAPARSCLALPLLSSKSPLCDAPPLRERKRSFVMSDCLREISCRAGCRRLTNARKSLAICFCALPLFLSDDRPRGLYGLANYAI